MNIEPSSSEIQSDASAPASALWPVWPIVLLAVLLSAASGFVSFVLAVLSIDKVVIQIFLWINVSCVAATVVMLVKRRYGLACLLAISPAPVAFGASILYLYVSYP